jgi:serine/threonine-protein kinase RsbW
LGEVVVVMRRGFRREIDALEEIFQFLEGLTVAGDIDDRAAFTVNLVVEELFTNMVRHNAGGGGEIDISIERVDDGVRLVLVDPDAEPFDPASVPPPPVTEGIGDRQPGGLGLHLVHAMVDDVRYEHEPGTRQMRVAVFKRLES